MTKEAMLYEVLEDGKVHCLLCSQDCRMADSKFGFCKVRENSGGKLYTHAYGEVVAANVDPIEKKPLYHFLPGTFSFSIATAGCNFRCSFCQNWQISQIPKEKTPVRTGHSFPPRDVVRNAKDKGCKSISYTYTEPTIFFEYAYDTAKLAKEEGLLNVFVTNGYMSEKALRTIQPYLDACNVDLKSFQEEFYKDICRARLQPVLDSIQLMRELDIWVEVTTLVVPYQNDSQEELTEIARFIAGVDPNIPWHISRFHPDYKYTDTPPTPVDTLRKAQAIGKDEGLKFIYIGNVPGASADTLCPGCGKTIIRRSGFSTQRSELKDSRCPNCGEYIAGVF